MVEAHSHLRHQQHPADFRSAGLCLRFPSREGFGRWGRYP